MNLKSKSIFTILVSLLLYTNTFAQITYEKRIELALEDGYVDEQLLEFGKLGFLLRAVSKEKSQGQEEWKYDKYDTNLEKVGSTSVILDKKFFVDESLITENRTHTLFKDKKGNFSLITVNAESLELSEVKGAFLKKTWTKQLAALGDFVYLIAGIKREPFIYAINWKTGKTKLIPVSFKGYNPKNTTLDKLQVIKELNEIYLFVTVKENKRNSRVHILRFDDAGNKKGSFELAKGIENNIMDVSVSRFKNDQNFYVGTYSEKYINTVSEGVFLCLTEKNNPQFIKFYKYLELENFLNYLPEKKKKKVEKKQAKKEEKGKDFKINYRITAHNVIELDDGYLFLGEAYYPTYRSEPYQDPIMMNGRTQYVTRYRMVFDGYQYTHAILAKINREGDLIWDQIFSLSNASKTFFTKEHVAIAQQTQNSIKLVYSDANNIQSKSFDFDGNILNDFKSEEIAPKLLGDKTKRAYSNINFWFGNYFIAYGNQKIKNKSADEKKRKVYFISKIKFE